MAHKGTPLALAHEHWAQLSAFFGVFGKKTLDAAMLAAALPKIRLFAYPKDAQIVDEDEPGREMYLIISGSVSVSREGTVLASLGRGDIFGEISALMATPRQATVTTTMPCETLVIDEASFATLRETLPELTLALQEQIIRRMDEIARKKNLNFG